MRETRKDELVRELEGVAAVLATMTDPIELPPYHLRLIPKHHAESIRALLARVPAEGVTGEAVVCEHALNYTERCAVACESCRVAYRDCIVRATPPAAETGEPVAWGVVDAYGKLISSPWKTKYAAEAAADELRQGIGTATAIPLYAAPAPREVSEAMVTDEMMADAMMAFQGWDVNDEMTEETRRKLREHFLAPDGIGKRDRLYVSVKLALRAALSAETGRKG